MAGIERDDGTQPTPRRVRQIQEILAKAGWERRKPPVITPHLFEIDLSVSPSDLARLERELAGVGLRPYRPARNRGHRFFLGFGPGGWVKVDAKLDRPESAGRATDLMWLARRRRGMVVALLGADGAGKSTAGACAERAMPLDVVSRYLGAPRSSTGNGTANGRSSSLRSYGGLVKWTGRTVLRLWSLEVLARRGTIVICDRHPIEAGRIGPEPRLVRWAKRSVVRLLTPRPDLVILLDAPGQVLFARKGEHSPEQLEQMTRVWRAVIDEVGGQIIDASQPAEQVCAELQEAIWSPLSERRTP